MTVLFVVATGREDRPVTGFDSMIAGLPPALVRFAAQETYPVWLLEKTLRRLSEMGASGLGETLHHADWVITTDPQVVEEKGMTHGCPSCRSGTDLALASLRDHPDQPLLVGLLYWAGPEAG